jgi:hypothetical protein
MDRLVVLAPTGAKNCYAEWLDIGRRALQIEPRREIAALRREASRPEVDLAWMGAIERGPLDRRLKPLAPERLRLISSATERMTREKNAQEWELIYRFGVEPHWQFARERGGALPADVRGTLIHEVLERIRTREDLAELLEERIGELDSPELMPLLAPGTEYRRLLEEEIERVLGHPDWSWYTRDEHHRELQFLYRSGRREWLIGAFDLYRPVAGAEGLTGGLIVDFKTHVIGRGETATKARDYVIQAEVYADVARELRGGVDVRLHFTHPNVVVDMSPIIAEARARRDAAGRSADAPEQTDLFS